MAETIHSLPARQRVQAEQQIRLDEQSMTDISKKLEDARSTLGQALLAQSTFAKLCDDLEGSEALLAVASARQTMQRQNVERRLVLNVLRRHRQDLAAVPSDTLGASGKDSGASSPSRDMQPTGHVKARTTLSPPSPSAGRASSKRQTSPPVHGKPATLSSTGASPAVQESQLRHAHRQAELQAQTQQEQQRMAAALLTLKHSRDSIRQRDQRLAQLAGQRAHAARVEQNIERSALLARGLNPELVFRQRQHDSDVAARLQATISSHEMSQERIRAKLAEERRLLEKTRTSSAGPSMSTPSANVTKFLHAEPRTVHRRDPGHTIQLDPLDEDAPDDASDLPPEPHTASDHGHVGQGIEGLNEHDLQGDGHTRNQAVIGSEDAVDNDDGLSAREELALPEFAGLWTVPGSDTPRAQAVGAPSAAAPRFSLFALPLLSAPPPPVISALPPVLPLLSLGILPLFVLRPLLCFFLSV